MFAIKTENLGLHVKCHRGSGCIFVLFKKKKTVVSQIKCLHTVLLCGAPVCQVFVFVSYRRAFETTCLNNPVIHFCMWVVIVLLQSYILIQNLLFTPGLMIQSMQFWVKEKQIVFCPEKNLPLVFNLIFIQIPPGVINASCSLHFIWL